MSFQLIGLPRTDDSCFFSSPEASAPSLEPTRHLPFTIYHSPTPDAEVAK